MTMLGFPGGTCGKEPACQCRRQEALFRSPGQEDPPKEGMAAHSSILAWTWTEEPGGLQFIGSQSDMTGAVPKSYSFKKPWPYPNLVF